MSGPADDDPPTASEGTRQLDLRFVRSAGRTVLAGRRHSWPYSVGRVFSADDDAAEVIVQSGSGGIISGDRLRQRLTAGPGARARVRGQGAMSVHRRGSRAGSREHLELEAENGARLENLAEPRVLHDGSDFTQRTVVDLRGGVVVTVEAVTILDGDVRYDSEFEIRSAGVTVSRERMLVGSRDLPSGIGAFGVVLCAGPAAAGDEAWRRWSARYGDREAYGAASVLPFDAGVVSRIAARTGLGLRSAIDDAVAILRIVAPGRD